MLQKMAEIMELCEKLEKSLVEFRNINNSFFLIKEEESPNNQ